MTVAINVDDPSWTEVVQVLMPDKTDANWQVLRDKGEIPIARGTAMAEGLVDYLAEVCPAIAPALLDMLPPDNGVRSIIMSEGGASVYYVQPFPHFQDS